MGTCELLVPGRSGTLTWTWTGGQTASAGYFVEGPPGFWTVTLHYQWRDQEEIRLPIRIDIVPTPFDGERRWLIPTNRQWGTVQPAGRKGVPPAWYPIFRLSDLPSPDVPKLEDRPSKGTGLGRHREASQRCETCRDYQGTRLNPLNRRRLCLGGWGGIAAILPTANGLLGFVFGLAHGNFLLSGRTIGFKPVAEADLAAAKLSYLGAAAARSGPQPR